MLVFISCRGTETGSLIVGEQYGVQLFVIRVLNQLYIQNQTLNIFQQPVLLFSVDVLRFAFDDHGW